MFQFLVLSSVRRQETMRAQKIMSLAVIPVLLAAVACRTKTKAEAVQTAEKYMAAGEYGKAIIEYKNALKVEPRSAELQYKLGQAYVANGQLHEAFLSSSKAIELGPDYVSARIAQGRLYLAANQPDEAMKNAQGVLAKNADNTDAQMLLADAYAGKKNLPEAIKVVEGILQRHPDSIPAYLKLGVFYAWQDRPDAALPQFQKAVNTDPKSVEARQALAAYYYASGKQPDRAEEQLRAAVAAHPDSVEALQALAIFCFIEQRFSEAEPVYKDLVKLRKNSADSRFTLANFYLQTGKTTTPSVWWAVSSRTGPRSRKPSSSRRGSRSLAGILRKPCRTWRQLSGSNPMSRRFTTGKELRTSSRASWTSRSTVSSRLSGFTSIILTRRSHWQCWRSIGASRM